MLIDQPAPRLQMPNIPHALVQQIREQMMAARPGMEAVGRIVLVNNGQSARYDPLVNYATKRDQFNLKDGELNAGLQPGEQAILVHTHPNRSDKTHPSRDDLQQASTDWLGNPYAVFSRNTDSLGLYTLNKNRRGYSSVGIYR